MAKLNHPANLKYSKTDEWVRVEGDVATVGITDYAQDQLGDIVYVELPEIGKKLAKGAEAAVVESVKAASEVYAPVAGEVVAVNQALADEPAKVNESPEVSGWFLKLKPANPGDLDALMDETAYKAFLETI
jgi:glycine cleavage system H protein